MYQLYLSNTDGDRESQCIAHTCLTDSSYTPAPPAIPQLVHHQGGGSQAFRWCRKPIKGERTQWVSMARGQCSAQIHVQISFPPSIKSH